MTSKPLRGEWATYLLLGGLLPLTVGAGDWPQFLGPQRNGVSADTGLLATWPAEGPPQLWQEEVGSGYSGPVIVGKRLLLFHRGDDSEVLDCLSAADGKPFWHAVYQTNYTDDYGKG